MNKEVHEERPALRIEQPPDWWLEKMRQEEMRSKKEAGLKRGVVIIDIASGEEISEQDENGAITIKI